MVRCFRVMVVTRCPLWDVCVCDLALGKTQDHQGLSAAEEHGDDAHLSHACSGVMRIQKITA